MWQALVVVTCVISCSIIEAGRFAPNSIQFRVQSIAGKGLGVIAARDILVGEMIMTEKPLLSLTTEPSSGGKPSPADYARVLRVVEEEVDRLPKEGQDRFFALTGYARDVFDDDGGDDDGGQTSTTSSKTTSALDIFRTNALPMAKGCAGVFPDLARLNSHCRPNVHYSWDDEQKHATVYAVDPILAGQELNICYMGPCFPRRDRRGYLQHNFGFTCGCSVCALKGDQAMESDHRRATLAGLEHAALQAITDKDGQLALTVADHRLRMMDNEGLGNAANRYFCELDVFYALANVSKHATPAALKDLIANDPRMDDATRQRYRDAGEWMARAHRNAVISKGSDSSAAARCEAFLAIVKSV
jgi:hypothetical protein